MYFQCNKCFFITNVSKDDKNDKVCPKCNNSSEWVEYPIPAASGFLNQAFVNIYSYEDYIPYDFHELQAACLFLCALYEILLEGLVTNLMCSMGTHSKIIDLVLNSNRGQEKVSLVFKNLSGITIKEGFFAKDSHFYDYMKEIIENRNKYIHGCYSAFDQIKEDKIKYICSNIIELFVFLNNQYCVFVE